MKPSFVFVIVAVLFMGSAGHSQTKSSKPRLVELPKEEMIMVIVNQPESPLKLDGVSLFLNLENGRILQRYRVRNLTAKAIATFTVHSWNMTGSGGTLPVLMTHTSRVLGPSETLESFENEDYEIIKLDDVVRTQLKRDFNIQLTGKIGNIFFLMVDFVGFVDGSRFSDGSLKDKLGLYLTEHYRFPD